MRRLCLLTVFAAACASPTPSPSEPFTVLSWNVRYGSARDGHDSWPLRRDDLARQITATAPAILGVQEALDFQLEFLHGHLPHHRRLGQGRDGGTRGEHAALFVDTRRFAIVAHGDFWLSDTPDVVASVGWDAALTRICTWAELQDVASQRRFTVWNTHFDHRGTLARERAAALLAARLADHPAPHLVLGDFNAGERSAPLMTLRAAGLRDTFRDVHPGELHVGTFHAFSGHATGEKIDHVLVSAGLRTLAAAIHDRPGANGRWPSDHHGISASVALAP